MPRGIYFHKKHSEESKKKMSEIHKGRSSGMLGKKHSEATKQILSEKFKIIAKEKKYGKWWKGRHQTEEHKQKISRSNVGKPKSELHIKNIILSHLGKPQPWHSGKNHPNWQGGITPLRHQIWSSLFYQQWRKNIFERDDYTCQLCKVKGGQLQIDHYPRSFHLILEDNKINSLDDAMNCQELWDVNNGRTLCVDCHRKTDTWGRPRSYKLIENIL